jgi:pSer/pThr/pTyr-binding forkhead associated (FHA) protein
MIPPEPAARAPDPAESPVPNASEPAAIAMPAPMPVMAMPAPMPAPAPAAVAEPREGPGPGETARMSLAEIGMPPAQPAQDAPSWSAPMARLAVESSRRSSGAAPLRLVLVQRDGSEGDSTPLRGAMTIGRRAGDLLFPNDGFLSPLHARVEPATGGGVRLSDLGARNGVFVRISRPEPVFPGDTFLVGHHLIRLENVPPSGREQEIDSDGVRLFGTPTPLPERMEIQTATPIPTPGPTRTWTPPPPTLTPTPLPLLIPIETLNIPTTTTTPMPTITPAAIPEILRGKILFMSDRLNGKEGLFAVNPDGSGLALVTDGWGYLQAREMAEYSPDRDFRAPRPG